MNTKTKGILLFCANLCLAGGTWVACSKHPILGTLILLAGSGMMTYVIVKSSKN